MIQYFVNMGRQLISILLLFVVANYFPKDAICSIIGTLGHALIPDCGLGAKDVSYRLFNSDCPDGVTVDKNSKTMPLKKNVTTGFVIHGFTRDGNGTRILRLVHTWLGTYDINVFLVDWGSAACSSGGVLPTQLLSYPSAVNNTRIVGEEMAEFIGRLVREYGLKLVDTIVAGYSLGGQVAAFCGKRLQQQGTGTVFQIIALDPAGPGFETSGCGDRICATDAEFVQVFHTSYTFGMHREGGDVDFYFNGGANQPCCQLATSPICSHSIAIDYLADIFEYPECKYIGKKWNRFDDLPPTGPCSENTCSVPGPLAYGMQARGSFYVDTKDMPEYCACLT